MSSQSPEPTVAYRSELPQSRRPRGRGGKRAGGLRPSRQLTDDQWRVLAEKLDLSARQLEIIRFIFDGLGEATIGAKLGISSGTVHTYIDRMYKKLNVSSRCELVVRIFLTYVAHERPGRNS